MGVKYILPESYDRIYSIDQLKSWAIDKYDLKNNTHVERIDLARSYPVYSWHFDNKQYIEWNHMKYLERIKNYGSISNNRKKKTLFLLEVRETLSSLSMWNSDRYSEENCKKFFQEFRYYDKVVRQIKSFE